jgi:small GTP-binding protein
MVALVAGGCGAVIDGGCGQSTLMSNLSGVHSEVAAYEFTTLTTVPGVIQYKGAKIQLLDLPGIIEGAKDGKGRGRQVGLLSFSGDGDTQGLLARR